MKTKYMTKRSKDSYLECLMVFPLISIKNDEHLAEASSIIDDLAATNMDQGKAEYFDALCDLIESYEDKHVEIEQSTPHEMLAHLIESRGMSQMQLSRETRISRSTISEILSGKDKISKRIANRLADYFEVSLDLFLRN